MKRRKKNYTWLYLYHSCQVHALLAVRWVIAGMLAVRAAIVMRMDMAALGMFGFDTYMYKMDLLTLFIILMPHRQGRDSPCGSNN